MADLESVTLYMYTILADKGKYVQRITNLEQIKVHEKYDDGTMYNDIALIELNEAVPQNVKPAVLPKAGFSIKSDNQKVSAIGWGDTSAGKFFFHFSKFDNQLIVFNGSDNIFFFFS